MPKKQTASTEEQAIANARVYYEQLEMKKKGLQQSTKAAPSTTPKVSAPMARGKGLPPRSPTVQFCKDDSEAKSKGKAFYLQMMEKEQMKRDATKKSSVETRSKASARTSARVAPSVASVPSSHATRPTAQERIRLQQFYQTLQEKEDQKQYPKYHATASSYLPSWDLWGPLFICLTLGILLSMKAPTNQAALTFAAVFLSIWVGSTVVTINAQLLGGTISFFQSVCVLGYSVFPLMIAALIIGCLKLVFITWLWVHLIVVVIGCLWALRISSVFISLYVRHERRALALYPVVFFYTFLAWLILLF
jgi:protein YIPF6